MLRSSFIAASAVILCCATANGQAQVSAHKMLGPIKDAGIFHVGTGGGRNEARRTAHGTKGAHRRIHAARYVFLGAVEEGGGASGGGRHETLVEDAWQ